MMITKRQLAEQVQYEYAKFKQALVNATETQRKTLLSIIQANQNTIFGQDHHFSKIKDIKDYRDNVPLRSYDDYAEYIERAKLQRGVLSSEPVVYWARTSGSSGTAKLIPLTQESLKQWFIGAKRNIIGYTMYRYKGDSELNGKIVAMSGPPKVGDIHGVPVGYISGIVSTLNLDIRDLNPVPENVMEIKDYDRRMFETTRYVLKENVMGMLGITSFSLNLLNYIKFHAGKAFSRLDEFEAVIKPAMDDNGHIDLLKLWPNFRILLSTGVMYEACKPQINALLGDVWVSDFYSGTEGAYACSYAPEDPGLTLNVDLYYFEFREPLTGNVMDLSEVRLFTPYEVIITTANGLYRYSNGDVVEFVSLDPPQVKVKGRTTSMVNLTGEKLNEDEVTVAVNKAADHIQAQPGRFMFFGWLDQECFVHHCLAIEMENSVSYDDMNAFMEVFTSTLKEIRIAYRNYSKTIIKPPHFVQLLPGTFAELERRKSQEAGITGHTKIKTIVTPQIFKEQIIAAQFCNHDLPQNWESSINE